MIGAILDIMQIVFKHPQTIKYHFIGIVVLEICGLSFAVCYLQCVIYKDNNLWPTMRGMRIYSINMIQAINVLYFFTLQRHFTPRKMNGLL